MKPWFRAAALIAVLVPVTGCSIYFGDDDCEGNSGDDGYPTAGYRNPENGACEYWGGGGGGGCGRPAYDLPAYEDESGAALDWATCDGGCEALGELDCLAAAECRGAYSGSLCAPDSESDCLPGPNQFLACWGVAPSGPIGPGGCERLDAYGCSLHNDCIAVYTAWEVSEDDSLSNGLAFSYCAPEPLVQGCYSDAECPSGYDCTADTECNPPPGCGADGADCDSPVCYGQCVPVQNTCDAVDCGLGYHCEEECYPCDDADGDGECPPQCQPICVPDYNSCDAVECGLGSHCELQCTGDPDVPPMDGCYPVCVPDDGNGCEAIDCESGYHCEETCAVECTPDGVCGPPECTATCEPDLPTDSCEVLTSEDACVARPDCVAVYQGENCECYPWGCTCQTLTFERCEAGLIDEPPPGPL